MPNLFLSGAAKFIATGSQEQVNDVMSDVESGFSSINVDYEEDGITNVVEFRLKEKVSGTFEFVRLSDTNIEVTIDGVIKTSAQAKAVAALVDGGCHWVIYSISGGYRSIALSPATNTKNLTLSKKVPKP